MLPSTSKEQRGPLYGDLVPLIVPGFLTARLHFGDLTLGVRSLSANDLNLLRGVAREGGPNWPFHIAAASIWAVDGVSLLESHPYTLKIALELLRSTHKSVARAVFSQALSFFNRMKNANLSFESFLYEEESRRLWKSTNNGTHPIWVQPGIPGLERLGQNPFQSSWVQWNRSEDDRHDDDYAWSLTKVIVSVTSSKSAKKLDARDKSRIDAEKSRRAEVQDKAFYRYAGWLDASGEETAHPLTRVHNPRTASELSEEMRRWVSGEQDFHDKIVADYKEKVRVEVEAQEIAAEAAYAAAAERRLLEERYLGAGVKKPALVGYTQDQLSKLRPQGSKPGAKFIVEASPVARTFNKYLRDTPDAGALAVKDGRVVVYREPVTKTASGNEDPPPTLNDRISNRKPTLNG